MHRTLLLAGLAAVTACVGSNEIQRRAYDYQYQEALRLCGHPDAAFQAGYNAGHAGRDMHGEFAQMCTPDAQADATASYQRGFVEGARNAPITVVHHVVPAPGTRTTATSHASECTFDSDCGGAGYHCRSHECLGYGAIGDRCVFNEDCANDHCFGGTCRE